MRTIRSTNAFPLSVPLTVEDCKPSSGHVNTARLSAKPQTQIACSACLCRPPAQLLDALLFLPTRLLHEFCGTKNLPGPRHAPDYSGSNNTTFSQTGTVAYGPKTTSTDANLQMARLEKHTSNLPKTTANANPQVEEVDATTPDASPPCDAASARSDVTKTYHLSTVLHKNLKRPGMSSAGLGIFLDMVKSPEHPEVP